MIGASSTPAHRYLMSGLSVRSAIALPMQTDHRPDAAPVDVTIELGDVPDHLNEFTHRGANWWSNADHCLLILPGIGRFLASGGRQLTVMPDPGIAVDDLVVFITGTVMSAVLYQRGAFLLHASAVVHDGRAYVFCGSSGAGKSTLSAALVRAGCEFLSDDLCSIRHSADAPPLVEADGRTLRLYDDSIRTLGLADAVGARVRQQIEKFYVEPSSGSGLRAGSVPLGAIYMLGDVNPTHPEGLTRLPPLDAAQALLRESYRRRLALAYSAKGALAARTATLLKYTGVFAFHRRRDLNRLDEGVELLMSHWKGLS